MKVSARRLIEGGYPKETKPHFRLARHGTEKCIASVDGDEPFSPIARGILAEFPDTLEKSVTEQTLIP